MAQTETPEQNTNDTGGFDGGFGCVEIGTEAPIEVNVPTEAPIAEGGFGTDGGFGIDFETPVVEEVTFPEGNEPYFLCDK